jgi:hypothetical protein
MTLFREKFTAKEVETAMERLRPEDREQMFEIGRLGGDHWQRTLVTARFTFPSEDAARAAGAELQEHEFTIDITQPVVTEPGRHLAAEIIAMIPAPNVEALCNYCSELAERHGGAYEGWDVRLVQSKYGRSVARQLALEEIMDKLMPGRRKQKT